MINRGMADDVQLATLTRILDEYCEQAGTRARTLHASTWHGA
ncbi:hypothetical protein HNQ71_003782 [Mesorhizobium sangaii]|uniref:Uncharacterized protein n=1 Tax=Mesorhizobium sangaii TaxID=505389 RepID=A0A841PEI6_9HYPH|nr:hypothetical protein [Mesorhizobium sangaii]